MNAVLLVTLTMMLFESSQSIFMRMVDGKNKLVVNSSYSEDLLSISLSTYGSHNDSFYLQSEMLSPETGKHKFTHSVEEGRLLIDPPLENSIILFNDYDDGEKNPASGNGQFWIALKHQIKRDAQNKKVHFVPLLISEERRSQNFLLPAFPQPFSFLPAKSFYKCGDVLLSISQIDHYLDLAIFSSTAVWKVNGKWDWSMRNSRRGINYGRHIRLDKQEEIQVSYDGRNACSFKFNNLPGIPEESQIWRNKSYQLSQVLQNAIVLDDRPLSTSNDL